MAKVGTVSEGTCASRLWLSLVLFAKRVKNLNNKAKLFLAMATFDCSLNLTLSIVQLVTGFSTVGTTATGSKRDESKIPMYVYWSTLEIMTVLFFFYFAWDSVLTENVYELWAFQLARGLATTYAAVQYFLIPKEKDKYNLLQLILMTIFQCFFWATAYQLQRSFGWWAFRRLGADAELKKMYKNYQLFLAQVKFDLQCGLMMVMMSVFFFAADTPSFIVIEVLMLSITIVYAYMGTTGIRIESRSMMRTFFAVGVLSPINIIIKASLMIAFPRKFGRHAPYLQCAGTALVAIVNRATLMLNGVRAYGNFDKGLKENAFEKDLTDGADMAAPFVDYVSYDPSSAFAQQSQL